MDFVDLREFISPTEGELPGSEVDIFTDIDLVPLDESDGSEDGDDSLLQHSEGRHLAAASSSPSAKEIELSKAQPKRKVIPFNRILKKGMKGQDVVAIKRALQRANARNKTMRNTSLFGEILRNNVKKFQHAHGLRVDGQYGPKTHAALVKFFDGYSEWLYLHAPHGPKESVLRHKVVAAALYGYNHRDNIWYTQGPLRMQGVNRHMFPPQYPNWADCSAYATWCYYAAGAPDPNGPHFNYNGLGYTGTLSVQGKKVFTPQPGDLSFYKPGWPYGHVTIAINSTLCVSMGSSAGPSLVPIHYRSDYSHTRSYL